MNRPVGRNARLSCPPNDGSHSTRHSSRFKCVIPHAPLCQSLTSRYLRNSVQPSTSHGARATFVPLSSSGPPDVATATLVTLTGTENDKRILFSESSGPAFEVEIHRYITGCTGTATVVAPTISSSPPFGSAGTVFPVRSRDWGTGVDGARVFVLVGGRDDECGVRSSAWCNPVLLFFGRDCFLRSRLIVSACRGVSRVKFCNPSQLQIRGVPFRPPISSPSYSCASGRFPPGVVQVRHR